MQDLTIKLIQQQYMLDEYGNQKLQSSYLEVPIIEFQDIYQSEFYNAAQLGLKPSITLDIAQKDDYTGEKVLYYEGRKYDVIRVDWSAQRDRISLICEERVNNG